MIITSRYKDITGQKFGRLTAVKRLGRKSNSIWLCECECGKTCEVSLPNLISGNTMSCGCLHKDRASVANMKHGKRHTRLYRIWLNMKNRCNNKRCPDYKWYGGRGIAVCDEWRDDFMVFYDWAMSHGYNDNLTIDRLDVNGNYTQDNCRWVTMKQQLRNQRNNRYITINGITKCLKDWCSILNLKYTTVHARITRLGYSIEQALELKKGNK